MDAKRNKKRIYLDYAATTPLDSRVKEAMSPYWSESFGNPGGMYAEGLNAKRVVTEARSDIAKQIGARSDEIIFTSGGTESNNLAIFGFARWLQKERGSLENAHFITSTIEHPSVLDCFKELARSGARVSYLKVKSDGIVDLEELKKTLTKETVFVSIMYANNEIGTIQPIEEIAKILVEYKKKNSSELLLLHSDASQAPLFYVLDMNTLGVDFFVLDAQKVYGPKGVGLLYMKKGVRIDPLFYGGKQERGMRPGTENVPGIVGFWRALQLSDELRAKENARLKELRTYFIKEVLEKIKMAELNGDEEKRLPNNINISFPGVDNEWLVIVLDQKGIAVGTRSACLTGDERGSYVVEALGKSVAYSKSSIRFTLGRDTTKENLKEVVSALVEIVGRNIPEKA